MKVCGDFLFEGEAVQTWKTLVRNKYVKLMLRRLFLFVCLFDHLHLIWLLPDMQKLEAVKAAEFYPDKGQTWNMLCGGYSDGESTRIIGSSKNKSNGVKKLSTNQMLFKYVVNL